MSRGGVGTRFSCFGTQVAIEVVDTDAERLVLECVEIARGLHRDLTRFDPESELCRLNRDPAPRVCASENLLALARAVPWAGETSGGLVDATCIDALERSGYVSDFGELAPASGPETLIYGARPAISDPAARWREVATDEETAEVKRPPGVRIDSGGLGKGLAADLIADRLLEVEAFAIDCGGDLRVGGRWEDGGRLISVAGPWPGDDAIAEVRLNDCGVATSGVGRRAWSGTNGDAHHLIDPGRGAPAHTGIVQATACAPTALGAEVLAKTALLGGLDRAPATLVHGGWLVTAEGVVVCVPVPWALLSSGKGRLEAAA